MKLSKQKDDFELPVIPDDDMPPPVFHGHGKSKPSHWQRFKAWVGDHKKLSIFLAIIIVLLLAGGGYALYVVLKPKPHIAAMKPAPVKETPKAPEAPKFYSPLTGLEVPDEATTKRQVTAIMIENSPDARPQSGLLTAGVIYEAIAEGGITRFAVLYQDSRPGLIGPVRSLRPYYLSWIAPYDAAIAHVGGSYNALNEVRSGQYKDIDQFFNGGSYWRATDRYAPHNVYTNFDKLDALNKAKGFNSSSFTGFPRKTETASKAPNATKINIPISSATFNVHYDYEPGSNSYIRSEGGKPHLDREGGQIKPKVIIAMKVPTSVGFEDGYREQMTVNNASGEAWIFEDGIVEAVTWKKGGQKDQLHFLNPEGKDININRGQTWITATPQSANWQ
jgi:hypothetical protein